MGRPLFVGSYWPVTWYALGQNAWNDNKRLLDEVF